MQTEVELFRPKIYGIMFLNDQNLKNRIEIFYKRFSTNTSLFEILIHELNHLRFMS